MNKITAVETYQCPGCMNGPDPQTCSKYKPTEVGCQNHHAGTMGLAIGTFALGMPNGFSRFGDSTIRKIEVFPSHYVMMENYPNLKTKFSVPVWKHLDEHGNTLMRWYSPRTNAGWSCVILGNCMDKFSNTIEITKEDIEFMD